MSYFYLASGRDTMVGTPGNDTFETSIHGLNPGDSIEGNGGIDEVVLSVNSGYRFYTTLFDFRDINIAGINNIRFNLSYWGYSSSYDAEAYFYSAQFQNAHSHNFNVTGSYYVEHIVVFMDGSGPFSAADWSFSNWSNGTGFRMYDDLLIVYGSNEDDQITGSSGFDHIFGYDGNDVIDASGGKNQIYGGNGNDSITGHANSDLIDGGDGVDHLSYDGLARSYNFNILNGAQVNWLIAQVTDADISIARPGSDADIVSNVETITFRDATLTFDSGSDAAFVMRLYHSALGREPDAQGFDYWLDNIANGMSRSQVANGFLFSPAFSATAALSDGDFVDFLYQHALGRPSDSGGKAYWINQLTSGTSRADVLIGFSESPEHRTQTADDLARGLWVTDNHYQQIEALYDGFGDRLPDLNGLQYWVGQLKAGASLNNVASGFANSPEFATRTTGFSNADLVEYMYNSCLDRPSDPGGKQYWVNQLDHGLSKGDLLLGFSMSPEHIQALETHLYSGVDFYVA